MNSLKTFLSKVIDYAGLYPPASLPLEDAFANFMAYQSADEAWMLSRFIIPAKRLAELPDFYEELSFSMLGRGGKNEAEFLENLKQDLTDIHSFRALNKRAVTDMFEVVLPASVLEEKTRAHDLVNSTAKPPTTTSASSVK